MENLMQPSREEEDLLDRSTKKVKLIENNDGEQENRVISEPEEKILEQHDKPSYKDMVVSSDSMDDEPEDTIRAINDELFPDHMDSEDEMPATSEFNPNPEIKITREEFEDWCKPWRNTLIVRLLGKRMGLRFMSNILHGLWAKKGSQRKTTTSMPYLKAHG
ncbi:hypothetical protein SESBI_10296 [Sesbania bispinosa]|nr:hypothetical protein SESBI_10296 [Sesbania bispinosa]